MPALHHFGAFTLDIDNRRLSRDGAPVALNARYFDALALLVRERGLLIGKQRFFDEVWADTVVSDSALTQCIKEIRRQLGDDAGDPRFVRTVPGHGYCFIAEVVVADDTASLAVATTDRAEPAAASSPRTSGAAAVELRLPRWLADTLAAAVGGIAAGLIGGALYGSLLAFTPDARHLGSLSVLLVMLALSVVVGTAGATGVGLGLALGAQQGRAGAVLAGAACGGLLVGGVARLLGTDAFALLVGQAPGEFTGALEGLVLGFALAAGFVAGGGFDAVEPRRPVLCTAAATALTGALIPLAGGQMMATSLGRIAASFHGSRLDLTPLGRLFGEPGLGLLAQALLGSLEGAVFGLCVAGALLYGRRRGDRARRPSR